ncbi:uncharacterized CRM domain-containing protein At3g25440, chloroplastic [Asparagus officinalis]|nr:uncharacterized CRM domain-containing protein At3g25440, chloroplastic [Asparagus officinalis]
MWAARRFQRQFLKILPLYDRGFLRKEVPLQLEGRNPIISDYGSGIRSYEVPLFGSVSGIRMMSTIRGRSMRSKVEKRMRRETGKTMREVRRAKKLRKKLMTEEERLIYNLRRAKKKVALLLQKLKKYELPELPAPRHDPELLTPEQLQAYKKIGFRNRNYVPVGVRGVFGGVVQNMHLHWKFHETVQVCCDNFPKEKIKEMATMLARLSGGVVVNIHNVKTIIMFRGRNYRQPKNLIPINTLTKRKALFKARFEQALDSQKLNIKKIEQQLRRKGVNPEDPIAMASIQRVASTFFRAIDEKQGTPYVFRGDRKPTAADDSKEGALDGQIQDDLSPEDSDQEELDRFIAEIEDAADQEWAAEEAAEKEEVTKIRYWDKEDAGMNRGRNPRWRSEYSEEDRHSSRGNKQRATNIRKWDSGDDISGESEEDSGDESDEDVHIQLASTQSNKDDTFKRQNRDKLNKVRDESDSEIFGGSEGDGLWESEDEKDQQKAPKLDNYNYHSGSEFSDEEEFGAGGKSRSMVDKSKKKDTDENWDSD